MPTAAAIDAAGTELVGDNVFVFVHATGERSRPVITARTGQDLILSAGSYDVRVQDTLTNTERWIEKVVVQAGKRTEFEARLGR